MNHAVIICSTGRAQILAETVASLFEQTVRPIQTVVSVPCLDDVAPETRNMSEVQVVISPRGSSVQRNTAVSFIDPRCDIVCFLDDDVELEPRYFEHLLAVFDDTRTVLASGAVVLDGKIKDPVS